MITQRAAPYDLPLTLRTERPDRETSCLRLTGELELYTAGAFQEEAERLAAFAGRRLIVDLTGVTFIDSAGISALLGVAKRMPTACALALVCDTPQCRAALDLVRLPSLIPTYETLDAALEDLDF